MENSSIDIKSSPSRWIFVQNPKKIQIPNHLPRHDQMVKKTNSRYCPVKVFWHICQICFKLLQMPPPPRRTQYKASTPQIFMWQHDLQHLEELCYFMVKLPMINLSREFIFIIQQLDPLLFFQERVWIGRIPSTVNAIYLLIHILLDSPSRK
jgi:hypothetical protein